MKKFNALNIWLFVAVLNFGTLAPGEETTVEKLETQKNKASDSVKQSYRSTKDQVCNMVHGKLECLERKVVNETKNLGDKVKTKATELKNKQD